MLILRKLKTEFEYYLSRKNYYLEYIEELRTLLEYVKTHQPQNQTRIGIIETAIGVQESRIEYYTFKLKHLKKKIASLAA